MDFGCRPGFGMTHNDMQEMISLLKEINASITEMNDKLTGGSAGGGFSAEGAKVNQVPTADGNGGWAWKDQQGDSSSGTGETTSGVYIVNKDTVTTVYGTADNKTDEQQKHCDELKTALLSGITIRIFTDAGTEQEVYHNLISFGVNKDSSGYPSIILNYDGNKFVQIELRVGDTLS